MRAAIRRGVEPVTDPGGAPEAGAGPRRRLARGAWIGVRLLLVGAVLVFIGRYVAEHLDQLREVDLSPDPRLAVAALITLLLSQLVFSANYRLLMRRDPSPPSLARAFALLTLPAIAKYVPGKVAVLVGTVWAFEHSGYSRRRGLYLLLYAQVSVIVGGLLVAGLYSVASGELPLAGEGATPPETALRLAPLLALAGVPFLHPGLLRRGVELVSGLLSLPPVELRVPLADAPWALAISIAGMALGGVGFALLALALGVPWDGWTAVALVGAYPLALCLGFLALVAPAGLGIREGVLLLALAPLLGPDVAIVLSLAIRLAQLAADVIGAGIGLAIVRMVGRGAAT